MSRYIDADKINIFAHAHWKKRFLDFIEDGKLKEFYQLQ